MAYGFDGGNFISYIPKENMPTAYPITIAGWYRTPTSSWTTAESIAVFTDQADGRPALSIIINNGGRPTAMSRDTANATNFALGSRVITANTWTHVAGTFASDTLRQIFIDGVAGVTDGNTRTVGISSCTSVQIGRRIVDAANAKGRIAEVGVWNEQLNLFEIQALAKGLSPISVRPEKLFFYVPLVRETTELVSGTTAGTTGSVQDHTRIYQ